MIVAIALVPQAAATFPQGGAIGMVPPAGMVESDDFTGFRNADGDSILIAELPPEAYAELAKRIASTPPGTALPNGVTLDGPGADVTLADGTPAKLYRGHQQVAGARHAKWLLLAGGKSATALVTIQIADARAKATTPGVEAALKTVRLKAAADIGTAITALPFTIGDRAGFRPVRTLMGAALILTEGERDTDPDGAQPLVIVASSLDMRIPPDRADYARKLFEGQREFTRIAVKETKSDGDDVLVSGTAVDRARVIALRQHMRFDDSGKYVRTVCTWPVADDYAARCDKVAASVTLK